MAGRGGTGGRLQVGPAHPPTPPPSPGLLCPGSLTRQSSSSSFDSSSSSCEELRETAVKASNTIVLQCHVILRHVV